MKWNKVLNEKGSVQKIVNVNDKVDFMILLGGKMEVRFVNNKYNFITKLTDGPDPIFYDFSDIFTSEFRSNSIESLSNDLIKRFKKTHLDTMIDEREFMYFKENINKLVRSDPEMKKRTPALENGKEGKGDWDLFFQIGVYIQNEETRRRLVRKLKKEGPKPMSKLSLSFRRREGNKFIDINKASGEDERVSQS